MTEQLTPDQAAKLAIIVGNALEHKMVDTPRPGELEPLYTGRCVGPCVENLLPGLDILGLTVAYDTKLSPAPVRFCGLSFRPDVSIAYHGQKVLAVEVKFAFDNNPQDAVAKALGQCVAYTAGGYLQAIALVITDRIKRADFEPGGVASPHIHLLVRNTARDCRSRLG